MTYETFVEKDWFERRCLGMARVSRDVERTARWAVQGLREFCANQAASHGLWRDGMKTKKIGLVRFVPMMGGGVIEYELPA